MPLNLYALWDDGGYIANIQGRGYMYLSWPLILVLIDSIMLSKSFQQFQLNDSTKLAFEEFKPAQTAKGRQAAKPPIILSHGGGQTRYAWKKTGERLAAQGYYALAYDHRGHGDSEWSSDGFYNVELFAKDQAQVAASFAEKPILVGASLGGLSSMLVEGELAPNTYRAIVLVDVTPTLNSSGADAIFSFMGEHVKEGFETLDEAANIIAEYTGRPRQADTSGLAKNLRLRDGRWYWHWDPNFIRIRERREKGPERMIAAAKNIQCPIFLVRGKLSDLVKKEQIETFLTLVPHAKYIDVEEARHMVAGDKNDIFTEALLAFIEEVSHV